MDRSIPCASLLLWLALFRPFAMLKTPFLYESRLVIPIQLLVIVAVSVSVCMLRGLETSLYVCRCLDYSVSIADTSQVQTLLSLVQVSLPVQYFAGIR